MSNELEPGGSFQGTTNGGAQGSTSPAAWGSGAKWLAGMFSCLMIAAVFSPILQNWRTKPKDSFPLSYYPMFSEKRGRTSSITYLVGIDAHGQRSRLPYRFAGDGGLNQVRRQINKMVENDDEDKLCRAVAKKVAARQKGWTTNVVAIELRRDTYDLTGYFSRANQAPIKDRVLATCRVERNPRDRR